MSVSYSSDMMRELCLLRVKPNLRGIHTCLISLNDEPRILLINNLSFNLFHISTSKQTTYLLIQDTELQISRTAHARGKIMDVLTSIPRSSWEMHGYTHEISNSEQDDCQDKFNDSIPFKFICVGCCIYSINKNRS